MLKIKGHDEFAKWWTYWMAKIDRSRVVVNPSPYGKKINAAVARFVDGDRNKSAKDRAVA